MDANDLEQQPPETDHRPAEAAALQKIRGFVWIRISGGLSLVLPHLPYYAVILALVLILRTMQGQGNLPIPAPTPVTTGHENSNNVPAVATPINDRVTPSVPATATGTPTPMVPAISDPDNRYMCGNPPYVVTTFDAQDPTDGNTYRTFAQRDGQNFYPSGEAIEGIHPDQTHFFSTYLYTG